MNIRLFILTVLIGISASLFSQDFYDVNTIETIEITFEESNWDELLDTYYSNDNNEKLTGSVVINGVEFNDIGVKYKGNSTYSANNAKNPLHIYLDYIIEDQNYDGYESIKLSNGKNDPSFVREVLSYEIVRKYMVAPLSNYAKVYINDSYYGMFSNSEGINGDFTDRRLNADKDNTRVKCNPEDTNDGNGPSLEYLGTDSADYYNYYEVKSDYGWQDLIDLTYEITNDPSDIENILDIDRAIWMMAFNNTLVNLDSYTGPFRQNYYLIMDDNGKFLPVTWDLNESLGAFESIDMGGDGGPGGGPPVSTTEDNSDLTDLDPFLRKDDTTYPLIELIFDNERYTKMYIAHCKTILEENFMSGWYLTKADSLQDLISNDLADDPNAFYSSTEFTGNLNSTQDNTIGISELMEDRITFLQSETAFQYTQPTIASIIAPSSISPYTTVTITAEVSNANYVHLGYRYSKDNRFVKIEMFDDGAHDDGASGDGTYGISFTVDESNTHYYIYAENDDAGMFSPEAAQHDYYKLSAIAVEEEDTDLVLNELMAKNTTIQADQNGEFDDWIELYNNTDEDISLLGYHLTDDDEDIMQWAFPDTVIAANSYLIVWADKDEEQVGLHANFKLSASGESVYLVNSEYIIVNSVTFGEQIDDNGYARVPNGIGDFAIQYPTFSAMNSETFSLKNNGLTVDEGSTSDVSTLFLSTFSPTATNSNITYTITTETLNGQIEHINNDGVTISSFTQQNLTADEIQYVHDGSNTLGDSFTFSVTDGTDEFTEQAFNIEITAIDDDAPSIINNLGLTLNQGTSAIITTTKLLAGDTEAYDASLSYSVTTAVINGQLEHADNAGAAITTFTQQNLIDGKVLYIHNSSATNSDSFIFSVSDGLNDLTAQTFSITILEIDEDAPTISVNTGISMNEGLSSNISGAELLATDLVTEDATLQYTVTEIPVNGLLEFSDSPGVPISSFTQQNLIDGKIQYTHDGSNTIFDSFFFNISDGENELREQYFVFTINPVDDDSPTITKNTGVKVSQGSIAKITSAELYATDSEFDDEVLSYTVTEASINGQLTYSNYPGVSISSFTQQDLIDGIIQYEHDGSSTNSDSLTFSVSDGANELSEQILNFYIILNTSIQNNSISTEDFMVYPNPTSSHLFIETTTGILNGSIYSVDGNEKMVDFIDHGNGTYYIDINHLSDGVYFLKIQTETGIKTKIILVN